MKNIIFFILFCTCSCWANLKIAFISDSSLMQVNSAIFNGIKNTAKELSATSGKQIKVELFLASNAVEEADLLSKALINGYSGAVVYPIDSANISPKISELKKSGFPVVVVGRNIKSSDALSFVGTNCDKYEALIQYVLEKRSEVNTKIACYFKGNSLQNVDIEDTAKIDGLFASLMELSKIKECLKNKVMSVDVIDFYSVYAEKNKIDIMRRDSYGEIFFSPQILSNMQPIQPDTDRVFALCIGALPMLEFYFATNSITDCIYDDYYGWGVFSLRAIVFSKTLKNEVKKEYLLNPVYVRKENYKIFVSDWQKWLR